LVVGIVVILIGVFAVATGRGGELAYEHADHAPLDLGPVSATDVALLRPPTALWGYNMQVTDEALDRIARALRDRDIEIAVLQRQLADLTHGRAERHQDDPVEPRSWVPKHERPRTEDEPADSDRVVPDDTEAASDHTEAASDDTDAGPDDRDAASDDRGAVPDDRDAAAEEQGW
jgi:hypothetical protein